MATFYKFQLPEELERGVIGGPGFETTVFPLAGGLVKRNIDWDQPVSAWDAGYQLLQKFQDDPASAKLDLDLLINIFYVMNGKGFSFLLKDWSDFEIGYENGTEIDAQLIATGTAATGETTYQLFKTYEITLLDTTTQSFNRTLTKFSDDSFFKVLRNDVETAAYTMNFDTGVLTLDTDLGDGETLKIRARYFNHVYFNTDKLNISMEVFNVGGWPSFPLIEDLGTGV